MRIRFVTVAFGLAMIGTALAAIARHYENIAFAAVMAVIGIFGIAYVLIDVVSDDDDHGNWGGV